MKFLQLTIVSKFDHFNSKAYLGCLNGFIAGANSLIPIDLWPLFEGNIIVGCFIRYKLFGKPHY